MLLTFMKGLLRGRSGKGGRVSGPIRLHIGGQVAHPDWKIFDVRPGPIVDYVGHCTDLSAFDDESVLEIYASHVLEHLGYQAGLAAALREFKRVLVADGTLRVSVPDLAILCEMFLDTALDYNERFAVMRMMFGGQINNADFHLVGLNEEILTRYLRDAGFAEIARVGTFGLFDDSSNLVFKERPISLNLSARKSTAAGPQPAQSESAT